MRTFHLPIKLHSCFLALGVLCLLFGGQFAAAQQERPFPVYDSTHETAVKGTIEKIVTDPAPGMPLGTHLILKTDGGEIDAHLGPSSQLATKYALATGQSVELTGYTISQNGGNVLLVRILKTDNQVILLRNEHGFPLRGAIPRHGAIAAQSKGGQS